MPSVMGLLEERERAARQRVEVLQAELQEAEAAWERFVIARQAVAEVLAEPPVGEEASLAGVAGERPARVAGAVPGSVVDHRGPGQHGHGQAHRGTDREADGQAHRRPHRPAHADQLVLNRRRGADRYRIVLQQP
ncbi:hypothetical protein [Streptomyces sp. NBC_01006]|uniref:hypothetical protein n=1 Tax=Streptomyces sp. NBC_01006 TaxID=2903716 RepID=UPI003863B2C0|nr:hypothetical protein OG509_39290 [Streptomyces sp. NBC_01006]